MALRIYRAPESGLTFQFEQGEQPAGYVLVTDEPTPEAAPKAKRRRAANKARKASDK